MERKQLIDMFSKDWFLNLEQQLKNAGLDSDRSSFDEIKKNLANPRKLSADAFASNCAYVILAGGFSQKTAKKKYDEIMRYLAAAGKNPDGDEMLRIFNNKNKIYAIVKIWNNRDEYTQNYYKSRDLESKIAYLTSLPHVGKITANHLARNLGENVVKYDIWIQRLGVIFIKKPAFSSKINNGKLDPDIKIAVDKMFAHLENETGLPQGYIDVVLWKACQNKLIKITHLLD